MLRNGLITVAAVLAYLFLICLGSRKKIRALPAGCVAMHAFLMAVVFQLAGVSAVNGIRLPGAADGFNFVPMKGVVEIVQTGITYREPLYALSNIGGNVAMFMPLGFFLPLLWKPFRRLWKTALFGFGVTLLIECTQIFIGRGFDVDDLLLNTLGAMLGYAAYRLLRRIAGKRVLRCAVPAGRKTAAWRLLPYLCILLPFLISFCFGFYDRAVYFRM